MNKQIKLKQCPGVLGGCEGKGVVKGDEGLCPKCLKIAEAD